MSIYWRNAGRDRVQGFNRPLSYPRLGLVYANSPKSRSGCHVMIAE